MDKKNQILIAVTVLLLVLNTLLFLSNPSKEQLSYDPRQFAIADTAAIQQIHLVSESFDNLLKKDGQWSLNEKYKIDQNFIRILMNVLHQISIARPLDQQELDEVMASLSKGVNVQVDGAMSKEFTILGSPNRTETYLISPDGKSGFLAEIPGYSDYLGSIFELSTQQWRDRVIIDGNWRSIQKLTLDYADPSISDLSIQFQQDFFKVSGVAQIDSNAVVSYLNQFEQLQANERIALDDFPFFDSLASTQPMVTLTIEDIYFAAPKSIQIFAGKEGSYLQLVLDTQEEPAIFERKRLDALLKKPEDFVYK
jgi:hypothetical protein